MSYDFKAIMFLAAVHLGAASLFAQTPGSIGGTVAGEDKKPVAGTVSATRVGVPSAPLKVATAADGSFALTVPSAGTYQLCVSVKGDAYVDPCVWSPVSPRIDVTSGQVVTGYKMILKKGTTLTVRLNDPQQALGATPAPGKTAPHVIVGIFTENGLFQHLVVANKDGQGRTLTGPIPLDKSVSLHLVGRDLEVTDSKGAKVDLNGSTIPVMVSSAAAAAGPPAPLTFTVNSKKP